MGPAQVGARPAGGFFSPGVMQMHRLLLTLLTALGLLALAPPFATTAGATSSGSAAGAPGFVTVIQALPDAAVDVAIDGRSVATGAAVGDVLGPFELRPGVHQVSFSGDGITVDSRMRVSAGASSDVVLHLPADLEGDPVVHSYQAPTGAIGPDKARVLLAHTATVAPADVEVDGRTVFTNIANGEFAEADVPAGTISVALRPSGTQGDPILGPLDLSLRAGTLSMVYAYGNPSDGSMNAIAHTTELAPDGSVQPSRIDTGTAGLATTPVTTLAADGATSSRAGTLAGLTLTALLLVALGLRRRRGPGSQQRG